MKTLLHKLTDAATAALGQTSRQRLLAVAVMLCCAGIAFAARAYSGSSGESAPSTKVAAMQPASSGAESSPATPATARERVKVVKIKLFDAGIYPREVHVEKGLIAISIEDYSGGSSGVIVDRETGVAPERAGRVDRAGPHWRSRGEMRLGPGRYRVSMADRPANQALLVVEP